MSWEKGVWALEPHWEPGRLGRGVSVGASGPSTVTSPPPGIGIVTVSGLGASSVVGIARSVGDWKLVALLPYDASGGGSIPSCARANPGAKSRIAAIANKSRACPNDSAIDCCAR